MFNKNVHAISLKRNVPFVKDFAQNRKYNAKILLRIELRVCSTFTASNETCFPPIFQHRYETNLMTSRGFSFLNDN